MGSSTAALLGLTWGGVQYPWSSARVLVPLILGFVGIICFMIYEALVPMEPTVPWRVLNNRTTVSGYVFKIFELNLTFEQLYYTVTWEQHFRAS